MKYTLIFAAAVLFLGGSLACAESITIENPSFEDPSTGHKNGALPMGWSVEGSDYGTELNPSERIFSVRKGNFPVSSQFRKSTDRILKRRTPSGRSP